MNELQRLITWVRAQIGTAETPPGSNNVIYNTRYYGHPVSGDNFPWCCAFVWDAFRETGLSRLFVGGDMTAYCPYVMGWAKGHGQWVTDKYRAGDLPLFDWNGDGIADHIGICTGVSGSALTTIEGNVDSAVREMTRSTVNVIGAYRPKWAAEPAVLPISVPAQDNETIYTVKDGDTLSEIADRLGVDMVELARINGISNINLIFPGQELMLPGAVSDSVQPPPGFLLQEAQVLLPVLTEGSMGQTVRSLQALLVQRGYDVGSYGVDGELGPDTLKALKKFQNDFSLKPSGEADGKTWEMLIG
jgi:hypothetical protein